MPAQCPCPARCPVFRHMPTTTDVSRTLPVLLRQAAEHLQVQSSAEQYAAGHMSVLWYLCRSFAGEPLERERFASHVNESYQAGMSFAGAKANLESLNRHAVQPQCAMYRCSMFPPAGGVSDHCRLDHPADQSFCSSLHSASQKLCPRRIPEGTHCLTMKASADTAHVAARPAGTVCAGGSLCLAAAVWQIQ